jgi:7,8-dihydroneopterin aldolase/epimerase/oxygenase
MPGFDVVLAMDTLFLRNFRLECRIGLHEWERKVPQSVRVDLEIGMTDSRAGHTDSVADTIDYGLVAERIREMAGSRQFTLVEALSEEIARIVLEEFGAAWAKVSLAKLAVIRGVSELGIVIERSR